MAKNELQIWEEKIAALAEIDPALAEAATQATSASLTRVQSDEISHPRMNLLQGSSEAVKAGNSTAGYIQHSITGQDLGKASDGITIIPIFYWFSRLYLRDINEGTGVLCRSNDGKVGIGDPGGVCEHCVMQKWTGDGDDQVAPECCRVHNWLVYLPDLPDSVPMGDRILVWDMRRSHYVTGKRFNSRLRGMSGKPFFHQFRVGAKRANNEHQNWVYETLPWGDTNRYDRPVLDRPDWQTLLPFLAKTEAGFEKAHVAGILSGNYSDGNSRDDDDDDDISEFEREPVKAQTKVVDSDVLDVDMSDIF